MSNNELAVPFNPSDLSFLKQSSGGGFGFAKLAHGQGIEVAKGIARPGQLIVPSQDGDIKECIVLGNAKDGDYTCKAISGPYRPCAVTFGPDNSIKRKSYNVKDPIYKQIATAKSVQGGDQQCWGTEVLFFFPAEEINPSLREKFANGILASFFYKNTNRKYSTAGEWVTEAGVPICTPVVLENEFVETAKFSWYLLKTKAKLQNDTFPQFESGVEAIMEAWGAFMSPCLAPINESVDVKSDSIPVR